MKVVHIVMGKVNPQRMNGVNLVVFNMATNLQKMGVEVEVWGITKNVRHIGYEPSFKLRLFQKSRFGVACPQGMKNEIIHTQDTLFHLHGGFIVDYLPIARVLTKVSKPFVFTPHGTYAEGAFRKSKYWIKTFYFRWVERFLLHNAAKVHYLGEGELKSSKYIKNINKFILLPNGCGDLSNQAKVYQKDSDGLLKIGFCGRLDAYHKGVDLLIKGFAQFLDNGGAGELHLIGDGPDYMNLNHLAMNLGVRNQIVFHGKVFGQEKYELIKSFDVFAHTSRHEGMPIAVLEALKLGVPCLLSKETNLVMYFENTRGAYCLSQNSTDVIAENLLQILKDKETNELMVKSELSKKLCETLFSWPKIIEKMVKEYKIILNVAC